MTQFLDVRCNAVGGGLTTEVNLNKGTCSADYISTSLDSFEAGIRGCDVLIATHGFNVDRAAGIACLSNWEGLLHLPYPAAFVGLLWPGDSIWAHGLDYPGEPKIADAAARILAPFIDAHFQDAASVSFASHSLGARVVLTTIEAMNLPVRRLTLMAGAIDNNCLNTEFQAAAAKIGTISILASRKDTVLSKLFPLGNLFAGIIAEGHPWWRAAIGHRGPVKSWPANFVGPYEIPDGWEFNHGDYLRVEDPPVQVPILPLPMNVPSQGASPPTTAGWREAFTAAFESTRFR